MSPNELDKALAEIGRLHREINRRADLEFKAAMGAGGNPVPEDAEKVRLIAKGEAILQSIMLAWNEQHKGGDHA